MKEKIGIEKLIELLNKYVEETDFGDDLNEYNEAEILDEETLEVNGKYHDIEYLYTKKFGFIKWLVENDKIDTSKANDKNLNGYEIELRIRAVKELVADSEEKTVLYLNLLMLLAISNSPIDDLILYLK